MTSALGANVCEGMLINPFLDVSFPPAWSTLLPANVVADITLAVERAQAKVDAIAAQSPDRLSYESTILALESSTEE